MNSTIHDVSTVTDQPFTYQQEQLFLSSPALDINSRGTDIFERLIPANNTLTLVTTARTWKEIYSIQI